MRHPGSVTTPLQPVIRPGLAVFSVRTAWQSHALDSKRCRASSRFFDTMQGSGGVSNGARSNRHLGRTSQQGLRGLLDRVFGRLTEVGGGYEGGGGGPPDPGFICRSRRSTHMVSSPALTFARAPLRSITSTSVPWEYRIA